MHSESVRQLIRSGPAQGLGCVSGCGVHGHETQKSVESDRTGHGGWPTQAELFPFRFAVHALTLTAVLLLGRGYGQYMSVSLPTVLWRAAIVHAVEEAHCESARPLPGDRVKILVFLTSFRQGSWVVAHLE